MIPSFKVHRGTGGKDVCLPGNCVTAISEHKGNSQCSFILRSFMKVSKGSCLGVSGVNAMKIVLSNKDIVEYIYKRFGNTNVMSWVRNLSH